MTDKLNEKSAGQLAYESAAEMKATEPWGPWGSLTTKDQKHWEFNATATPKAQTIKAP